MDFEGAVWQCFDLTDPPEKQPENDPQTTPSNFTRRCARSLVISVPGVLSSSEVADAVIAEAVVAEAVVAVVHRRLSALSCLDLSAFVLAFR